MGFDVTQYEETTLTIRNENLLLSEPKHESLKKEIIRAITLFKEATPSKLYNYFNSCNRGEERYPLTSIRARMTELRKDGDLIFIDKKDSKLYKSTEANYKLDPNYNNKSKQQKLF